MTALTALYCLPWTAQLGPCPPHTRRLRAWNLICTPPCPAFLPKSPPTFSHSRPQRPPCYVDDGASTFHLSCSRSLYTSLNRLAPALHVTTWQRARPWARQRNVRRLPRQPLTPPQIQPTNAQCCHITTSFSPSTPSAMRCHHRHRRAHATLWKRRRVCAVEWLLGCRMRE
jgi:hypothetical protein